MATRPQQFSREYQVRHFYRWLESQVSLAQTSGAAGPMLSRYGCGTCNARCTLLIRPSRPRDRRLLRCLYIMVSSDFESIGGAVYVASQWHREEHWQGCWSRLCLSCECHGKEFYPVQIFSSFQGVVHSVVNLRSSSTADWKTALALNDLMYTWFSHSCPAGKP